MKIAAFEVSEPLPKLKEPHAIAMLRPWVDVGSVGTVVLSRLERHFSAKELGRLAEPGRFYDFTRYRPMLRYVEGVRHVTVPNTLVNYAQQEEGQDFLFVRLLEPHTLGEQYVQAVLELFETLGVKRYLLVGGMYDVVPHTRPLTVSGSLMIGEREEGSKTVQLRRSNYEGPTSIVYMVSQRMQKLGQETGNITIHLPQYLQVEEDYAGAASVLKILCNLYEFPEELQKAEAGAKQYQELTTTVARNPELRALVERLESIYDARAAKQEETEESPPLSKDVEQFLLDIDKRFGKN